LIVYIGPSRALPKKVSIGGLMGCVAVIGVGLSLSRLDTTLGGLVLIGILPALIRTSIVNSQRIEDGRRFYIDEKIGVFLGSIWVMLLSVGAGMAAFWTIMLSIRESVGSDVERSGLVRITIGSALGGLLVTGWVLSKTWVFQDRQR
jgi:hypothetical protein